METEKNNEPYKQTFNFNNKNFKGIESIIHGKGSIWSYTYFFGITIMILGLFYLLPISYDFDLVILRVILLIILIYLSFIYIKTIVEIVVDGVSIRLRIFKKYKKFDLNNIYNIRIKTQPWWGTGKLYIKTNKGNYYYTLWVPTHESDRYKNLLKFIDCLNNIQLLKDKLDIKI